VVGGLLVPKLCQMCCELLHITVARFGLFVTRFAEPKSSKVSMSLLWQTRAGQPSLATSELRLDPSTHGAVAELSRRPWKCCEVQASRIGRWCF
jgi:hypothetical protein